MRETTAAPKRSERSQRFVKTSPATASNDTFEMANLYPRDTGLSRTIWVSPRGRARHDVRIKVCMTPGDRMDASNTAVVAVRPQPRLLTGSLPAADFRAVSEWIVLNQPALIDYWNGIISTVEFVTRMRRLTAPPAG
jgi:hypothetical protein